MDAIALVATVVVAAFVGVCVGFLARGVVANQALQSANEKAARIVAENPERFGVLPADVRP